jgi:hypothetical protein
MTCGDGSAYAVSGSEAGDVSHLPKWIDMDQLETEAKAAGNPTKDQMRLCKRVVVVTRRKTDAFADPKVAEVVVNMGRLEEGVAPHAQRVDIALAAFGVGKGSAKMPEEEVRKIEVVYPQAFCRAAKAGGARVCGVMTAVGADPGAGMKVREDHRREGEGCRVRQVRLPWAVPARRHSG